MTRTLIFQAKDIDSSIFLSSPDNGLNFEGIIPSFLNKVTKESNIEIVYLHVPSGRVEEYLAQHKLDGSLMNKEWLVNPSNFLFTKPFLKFGYYFFSTKVLDNKINFESYLIGKRICTHRSYTYSEYPLLPKLFEEEKSIRIDSSSDESMLKMLLKGRCDVTLINEHTADWLIDNIFKNDLLYRSSKPIFNIEVTMAFASNWQSFVNDLNAYIDEIEGTDQMEEMINTAKKIKY
ncbi:ABC transporter substrate-binding protein [Colwellia sp. M166]|jgi:ABC-type amino acid transport substrate-binding protein|uniref:substrate-binding periplasmic protein n=1 Tax=Colwellia sp. M166 TaxID=2583805 RepID=UPI00211EF446|nr:transporter substrate-binding domain-containing protein [Colwellia sp. M166]|tara:strand:+ start:436 stop:1137 length:702 start_codon:yes stop_codon:yes gene_type:complete